MHLFTSASVLLLICQCFYTSNGVAVETGLECGELFLTVSAIKQESIEANWKFTCADAPNKIKLFSSDPTQKVTAPLVSLRIKTTEGYYVTNINLTEDLAEGWDKAGEELMVAGSHCLNYWVAAYKNNTLVQKNCLKIQPTWMETYGDKIENIPLGKMFIPGTHNSGCYDGQRGYDTVNKYVITQDKDIWTQLVFGIRYLDFRIGYYNTSITRNEFWVNHDIFKVSQLIPLLREIKMFLLHAKKEVVILDLHRFPVGFKKNERERHKQLVDLLHKEIGDIALSKIFQKKQGPTLKEIWKQKKRLIVCYGDDKTAEGSTWLWNPLTQVWGNQQSLRGLKTFLHSTTVNRKFFKNPFWAAMAELTPSPGLVFLGILSSKTSLAHLADEINRNVTEWYRDDLANNANIVATDYFLGNDIIDLAIKTNQRKGMLLEFDD